MARTRRLEVTCIPAFNAFVQNLYYYSQLRSRERGQARRNPTWREKADRLERRVDYLRSKVVDLRLPRDRVEELQIRTQIEGTVDEIRELDQELKSLRHVVRRLARQSHRVGGLVLRKTFVVRLSRARP